LLIQNSTEQNGFQFHSTSIAIQQKSNEDSFSKLNKIYIKKISKGKKHDKRKQPQEKSFTSATKHTFSLQLHSQREITPAK
jgi:hypothetical protein